MNCDEVSELLELYALEALEPEERSEVAGHLRGGCSGCNRDLRRALALNVALLAAVPAAAPPPRLRAKVAKLAGSGSNLLSMQAAAGVIVLLALAAGWLGVGYWRDAGKLAAEVRTNNALERKVAAAESALSFLRDPATRPASSTSSPRQPRGDYFVNPGSGVLLIASNLPPLSPGQTYQMWVIPKSEPPRSAGLFQPDAAGGAVHLRPGALDLAGVKALAISVEPASGSPAPTTPPLLVTPVS